ncbi:MAG: hypothetical protein HON53_08520 [Planctomycetaceae bacterium]|jgi:hypothetical protein|nr:hypothetical protein [Planctomycetaceae bacterium]MBT6154546.1 hypothetical protein [Planctomycetaceae bacterium]MBT6486576.1 hypothetical protein [Planctomycetaceae bacterium]MBT6496795.1 hypothetical protein [Planctomycetaceae bacterium]
MQNITRRTDSWPRARFCRQLVIILAVTVCSAISAADSASAAKLWAGAAKVDITNRDVGLVNDPLYVKALVIRSERITAVIVTVDAVAIEEIGSIKSDYLPTVRAAIKKDLRIEPANVMINASHCHGVVCADVAERTIKAIKLAAAKLVPVTVGVGRGFEDRVQENRRLKLKDGRTIDVRHAYSMPADEDVAEVGPIDTEIGLLKLNREDGRTLAVVYNFACHPIQGVPNKGNTADMTGFASQVIEDNLSEGAIALFVQGCGGDINPVQYKDVENPRDAETLGNLLGLSTLKGLRKTKTTGNAALKVVNHRMELPRADHTQRIADMEAEQRRLLASLGGTSLNLKTFIPLVVKYNVSSEFPSYYSHRYLLEKKLGRDGLSKLDVENRANMKRYIKNILTMEQLTRLGTNMRLLRKHQASLVASGKRTISVEVLGIRIGDFVLVTFPGELTVPIGLNIKKKSPHPNTFVAGYTNGYIYYSPTADQLRNRGNAQEDSDCLLAPEWQKQFEDKVAEVLKQL